MSAAAPSLAQDEGIRGKGRFALWALALGAFGIGVTEFTPMGLLPQIAGDLAVSIPAAGLLISGYAVGVVLGAPLLTLTTGRLQRKRLLLALMGIFLIGNVLAAVAGSYGMLLVARIITALCHGPFFGVGAVVAAQLAPPGKQAGAVAAMFSGLAVANIVGVPFETWLGQMLGWRSSFWVTAGVGLAALAALRFALPSMPGDASPDVRRELSVLMRPPVLRAMLTTVLSSGAMFTVLTYIAPILQTVTGVTPAVVSGLLVLFGLGLAVGNVIGGKIPDASIDRGLAIILALLALILIAFAFTSLTLVPAAITLFAWGVATFATLAPLQTRVMAKAGDAPNVASAMNIGAFNLGNALGAALGGGVIGLDLGYRAVPIAGALLALASLAIVAATTWKRPRVTG